jgi:hypothetical protein
LHGGAADRGFQIDLEALLPRDRSPGSLHEGLDLVQGEAAIFVRVHSFEDPLVSRLNSCKEMVPSPSLSIKLNIIRIIMPRPILPGPIKPTRRIMPGPMAPRPSPGGASNQGHNPSPSRFLEIIFNAAARGLGAL